MKTERCRRVFEKHLVTLRTLSTWQLFKKSKLLRLLSTLKSTRQLAASIFIQSQYSKVYFNEMQALAASLQVGLVMSGKQPLGHLYETK